MRAGRIVPGLALAGLIATGLLPAVAQETAPPEPPEAPQPAGAWASNCSAPGRGLPLQCALEQRAVAKGTGRVIAVVSIRLPAETKKPVSLIQLPLGLFLPAGVQVDVDGDLSQNYPFQTCNAKGCFVGFPISDNQLKMMLNGNKLNITFQYLNKKHLVLPMSLAGFTEAYNRIK
jgi:invasion protein IalB